ncbi:GlsB/YeaQ/YmgE family stress response membrane protein [Actinoplanes sp. CA-054009]
MTVSSLVTALIVGSVLGLCGRWAVPAGRDMPFWVPVAVAVGTALLATVIARFSGVDTAGVTALEVILQVVFAAVGVAVVAATAGPRGDGVRRPR